MKQQKGIQIPVGADIEINGKIIHLSQREFFDGKVIILDEGEKKDRKS